MGKNNKNKNNRNNNNNKNKSNVNKVEENKVNENKVNENKANENKANENKVKENKVNENKANENKANENKVNENKANENKVNENKVNENKVNENKANENKVKENKVNENKVNENKVKENKAKENKKTKSLTKEQIKNKKRLKTTILGAVFTCFALIGFINVASSVVVFTGDVLTGKNQISDYENFISPVVMMDPIPFEDPSKLDEKFKIQTAIWSIVKEGETDKYAKDDQGLMVMPKIDIEQEVTRLFGSGKEEMVHEAFGDSINMFYYDEPTESYKIPITGRIGPKPLISKIENVDGLTRLTVNYVSENQIGNGNKGDEYDKTLYYYIGKENKEKFVKKVEVIPIEDTEPKKDNIQTKKG